jgi:TolB-like protein
VLPFENLSGPEDEYFSDGVTDEILNALSQVDGLRVAARSSCFAFKGRRQDLRVVAEALDVTSILEGSVRRAGPKLRITVQLVNAADGYQLWSERYDREMIDVFEVQEDIARAIAARLRGTLRDAWRHEFIAPFWLVTAAAAAGLTDRALEHVVQAVAARDPLVVWGHSVPFWDGVRTHARFKEAIRPVGVLR